MALLVKLNKLPSTGAKKLLCSWSVFKSRRSLLKGVSTWSPFASAFNETKQPDASRFNLNSNSGLFGIPELKDYTGFSILRKDVECKIDTLVKEATSPQRKRKMVEIFDEMSDSLCRVADMADFVRVASPNPDVSGAAEEACISLSNLVEKLNTDVALHGALLNVIEHGDIVDTDEVDKRVAELFLFDFEQSGIHLEEKKRQKFVALNEEIHVLGTMFQQGSQKPVSVLKNQLPENLQHVFASNGDNIMVTGLFSDHHSPLVREAAYRIFLHEDSQQTKLLVSVLSARHELAQLVGFDSYSHRANRGTIMETPENITDFLMLLSEKIKPRAHEDFLSMLKVKQEQEGNSKEILAWDVPFYTATGRQSKSNMSSMDSLPYFSLGCVMEGLNYLFQCVFGVRLQHVQMDLGEAWSDDIYKLAVIHRHDGVLGYIYCDFFERKGKPNQDCHFTIQGGRRRYDGSYQHPVVVLQLSLPGPRSSSVPTLLGLNSVDNLFHEFGHAMHSMLGRTRYQHVTGTRCSTDFAEVPSVLMEFFASDQRIISTFARHYKTGEPMKLTDVRNICKSKQHFAASDTQQQVFFSMLDQVYHGSHPLNGSTTDILAHVQQKYYQPAYVKNTAWQLRFGHLIGYGARYYAYLVSRAIAAQIWHTCFKPDPFKRAVGNRYREAMLAHGGERHPRDLVKDMLGKKPTVENLVDALLMDLEDQQNSTL